MNKYTLSGIFLFLGAFQFSVLLLVAEALRPTYSVHTNYISDLGVGPNNYIFNDSIVFLGAFAFISAIILLLERRKTFLPYIIMLVGIGAAGVGLFPENTGAVHGYFADITFIASGIAAIMASYSYVKGPFRVFSPIIGLIILASIFLYIDKHFLGLGVGGMERMIVYPTLLWALTFSGYLMNSNVNNKVQR